MAKRYTTGVYPLYDEKFIQLKNQSQILGRGDNFSLHNYLFDKRGCEAIKIELKGNSSGDFTKDGVKKKAVIPALKNALKELEEIFKEYCSNQENQGFSIPEEYPDGMLQKRLTSEAQLDVALEELVKIDQRLKEFQEPEVQKSNDEVLKYGMIQSGSLEDNRLVQLDGQDVTRVNGVFIINDPRSPFNQIPVKQYRQLAIQWLEDQRKADELELLKMQDEAYKKGKPVPSAYSTYGNRVPMEKIKEWAEKNLKKEEVTTK